MSNLSLHTEPLFCSSSHLPHHSSSLFSLGGNPVIVITPPSLMKTSQAGIQLHSAKNSFFYGLHSTNSSSIQLPSNKASVIFTLPAAALSTHTRCKYKMNRTPLALSVCLSPPPFHLFLGNASLLLIVDLGFLFLLDTRRMYKNKMVFHIWEVEG